MNSTTAGEKSSFDRILELYWSFAPTMIVHAAVKVGLFDVLEAGPLEVAEIARKTQCSVRGVDTLAANLVGLRLLSRDDQGRFALTTDSATHFLSSRADGYWGRLFGAINSETLEGWQSVAESVRSGKPLVAHNDQAHTDNYFADAVESILPMSWPGSVALADHLAGVVKLAGNRAPTAIDVACGSGVWGVPLAMRIPEIRIVAIDYEGVLKAARRVAERHGVIDRYTFEVGSLVDARFGTGHQVALIGHILHAIGEPQSRALLKKIFNALAPGGTVVVAEFVLDEDGVGPASTLYFAMDMLVHSENGGVFRFSQMAEWLYSAGFADVRVLQVPAASPLILATKP